MQTLKIKTHKLNRQYTTNHFFLLSKGNNAGKPMEAPCPNCFVVTANCIEERDRLYWLCFGLWQGGKFKQYLIGSVIPFIRIGEMKAVIETALHQIENKEQEFLDTVTHLRNLKTYRENIIQQLKVVNDLKRSLIYRLLR